MSQMREAIVAEIMKLVRPEPTRLERPTIAELEKILNSETTDAVNINPDGSVGVRPTATTVGAVADAVLRIADTGPLLAALKTARGELYQLMHPNMSMDAFLADPVIQEIDGAIAKAEGK